jgi:proteasome accessory factor C
MPERTARHATTAERLGRMLVVVPYLIRHPGTSLEEAASLFDVETSELRRDLDLLFLSGLPPYGPGDLIDVEVDEDGRIWIAMAEHFARPLRLTRREALAVQVRATELLATPGVPEAPALERALGRLGAALGETTGIEGAGRGTPPPFLDAVREAADDHRRIAIDYVAGSSTVRTRRTVDPESVFSSLGNWYVAAWDIDVDEERLFRIDRIASLDETAHHFVPRGLEGAGRPLYTPGVDDVEIRLLLRPASRWVAEYFVTTEAKERGDGTVEATLPAKTLAWAARLLLRLGEDAEGLAPPELALEVRELARRTLGLYRE